jgi:hypothetical protein
MKRTIVSLPLDEDVAKEATVLAKLDGKTRTEYLRDIVSGHMRMARFRRLQEKVSKTPALQRAYSEQDVVQMVREVRKERAAERQARA